MATSIRDIINAIEVERDQLARDRDRATAQGKFILDRARQEGRSGLTEDERADMDACLEKRKAADRGLEAAEQKLAAALEIQEAENATDKQLAERAAEGGKSVSTSTGPAPTAARPEWRGVATVGREERTYHRGNDRSGVQFLRDVIGQHLYRDPAAEQRLYSHMREEQIERGQMLTRAVGTGAFAGLTVPQYLTELYAPNIAALRPFADVCNKHPLPADGMSVNISRITTASSVALQATENSSVSATDMDDTLLTENVQTAAGQQTISRQALDRGTGIESVVIDDLFRRYATTLDSTLLNQATTGLTNVATATTYTDANPTGPELYPKILGAASGVDTALLGNGQADVVVMHSRRWAWLQSQMTSTWPMISQPNIATQASGDNLATRYGAGARGILPNGMAVIVDNNIGTTLGAGTEDEIYVVSSNECHLWEDPDAPIFIRAEQPAAATLGVLLVLYGYFAYSFRRYSNGTGKVNGTGLIAPVF